MAAPLTTAEADYQLAYNIQSVSGTTTAINIVLPIVATTFVILRIIAQKTKKASWHADDIILFCALATAYVLCLELILIAHFGMGHHFSHTLQPRSDHVTNILKVQFAIDMTWIICTYFVKLSNILLLARLFDAATFSRFRRYLHIIHAFLFLWTTAMLFSVVFRCAPVQDFWESKSKGGCQHAQVGDIVTMAFNALTVVILLILPIRTLWQLRLPMKQRVAVTGILGLGGFCLAVSAVRLYYAVSVWQYRGHHQGHMNAKLDLWASVEPCVGIVCACLPVLWPIISCHHTWIPSTWFGTSVLRRRSREEEPWWNPPPEELDDDHRFVSEVTVSGKRAKSGWNCSSSKEHKTKARAEVVRIAEVKGRYPCIEIAGKAFDQTSWHLEEGVGVAV